MEEYLRELTPVTAGMPVTKVASSRRINALQGAVTELARRSDTAGRGNGRRTLDRGNRRPRFQVWFHTEEQRLYVTEGMVATGPDPADEVIRPFLPSLEGVELREDPAPYFDCRELEPLVPYEVTCVFTADRADIKLYLDGEEVWTGSGAESEAESAADEEVTVWLLARVEFEAVDEEAGGGVRVKSLEQVWSSDIPWKIDQESSSSSSSSSSEPSSEESSVSSEEESSSVASSDESESEKSTAIVKASWDPQGYAALFVMESPEVRFYDHLRARITGRVTRIPIDPRFIEVCVKGTIEVMAVTGDRAAALGATVEAGQVVVRCGWWRRPSRVTVAVTGVRKHFAGLRFPSRSEIQYRACNRTINSAYPK